MKVNAYVEIDEAIMAGERVLDCVDEALDYLDSARNWGIFDLLSKGSFISSMVKHSKLDKAQDVMYDLERNIKTFAKELNDVDILRDVPDISTGDFMRFADIFFDNAFVDFMALSHISESKRKLEELGIKVEDILEELNNLKEEY